MNRKMMMTVMLLGAVSASAAFASGQVHRIDISGPPAARDGEADGHRAGAAPTARLALKIERPEGTQTLPLPAPGEGVILVPPDVESGKPGVRMTVRLTDDVAEVQFERFVVQRDRSPTLRERLGPSLMLARSANKAREVDMTSLGLGVWHLSITPNAPCDQGCGCGNLCCIPAPGKCLSCGDCGVCCG